MCLFTCAYLLFLPFVLCDRFSRMEKQISIIEQKVYFDATTFREDIADIRETLYGLSEKLSENNENGHFEKAQTQTKYDKEEMNRILQVIKRAVNKEKRLARKVLKDTLETFLEKFKQHEHVVETLRNELLNEIRNISVEIDMMKTDMAKNEPNIQTIQSDYKKVQKEIEDMKWLLDDTISTDENTYKEIRKLNKSNELISKKVDCHDSFGYAYGSSCYHVEKETMLTWKQAYKRCLEDGAYLAEIDSEEENTFLIKLATSLTPKDQLYGVWIGGSDLENEGIWVWQTSRRRIYRNYKNFKGNQPDGRTLENCLHLIRKYDWYWNDYVCERRLSYICEREL